MSRSEKQKGSEGEHERFAHKKVEVSVKLMCWKRGKPSTPD